MSSPVSAASPVRRFVTPLLALVTALVLAGCSFDFSTNTNSNGIQEQAPEEIARTALENLKQAESLRLDADGKSGDGSEVNMTVVGKRNGPVRIDLTVPDGATAIMKNSEGLFIRSPLIWQEIDKSLVERFAEQWVELPAEQAGASGLGDEVSLEFFLDRFVTDAEVAGSLERVEEREINGLPTVGLRDGEGGTMWVTTEGTAYPVLVEAKDPDAASSGGGLDSSDPFAAFENLTEFEIRISGFNDEFDLTTPADARTFEELQAEVAGSLSG